MLEWVAVPFSRGSSQPRDRTGISCTGGRFFTSWAIREARRITVLPYCAGFCRTSTWISHRRTYGPSLPPPIPLYPSRLSQSPGLSSGSQTATSHQLPVLHMVVYMHPGYSAHPSHPNLPTLCPQSVLYVCISTVGHPTLFQVKWQDIKALRGEWNEPVQNLKHHFCIAFS